MATAALLILADVLALTVALSLSVGLRALFAPVFAHLAAPGRPLVAAPGGRAEPGPPSAGRAEPGPPSIGRAEPGPPSAVRDEVVAPAPLPARPAPAIHVRPERYLRLLPVALVFILVYAFMELYPGLVFYPGIALPPTEELRRATIATTLVYLMLAAATFLGRGGLVYSRAVVLGAWVFSLLFIPLGRALLRRVCAPRPWWGHPVVVLGAGATGRAVIRTLQVNPGLSLKPVAVLDDDPAKAGELLGVPVVGGLDAAPALARDYGIPYAIIAMPGLPRERLLAVAAQNQLHFPHLMIIPDLYGFSSLWVVARDLGGVLGLEVREQLLLPGPCRLKRAMDLVLAVVGGLGALPFLILIALLIKLTSPGPAVFTQERLGRGGKVFRALKFRSMVRDAEAQLTALLAANPGLRTEFETYHKLRHDPRVTPVGRLLRLFSLDELPQLWNVLRGEMSLVGPRAYIPAERERMGPEGDLILRVVPGITGLWQVSGRSTVTFAERLKMDIYYVRNWSPWFDLYLLARTIWVVISHRGAY